VVLLNDSCIEALRRYIEDRRSGFVFLQDFRKQKGCFTGSNGYWRGIWTDYSSPSRRHKKRRRTFGRVGIVPQEIAKARFERHLQNESLIRPPSGRPMCHVVIRDILENMGERAGLRRVGPHVLRRSFATHLYDHGASLEVIQQLLGHTFITTTIRYTRLSTGRLVTTYANCHPRDQMNA